jgi:uncharacterized protein (TIGR02145 family)
LDADGSRANVPYYDDEGLFCQDDDPDRVRIMELCGGFSYGVYSTTEFCQDGTNLMKERCGGRIDTTGTYAELEFCQKRNTVNKKDTVLTRCGGRLDSTGVYLVTEFCQAGTDLVLPLCEGKTWAAGTQFCCNDFVGNTETQFCQENADNAKKLKGRCNGQTYDETKYCSKGVEKDYGYVADADGKKYKTVEIGEQTWMAENLNYAVAGSRCWNGTALVINEDTEHCDKYGRLYNWLMALALTTDPPGCTNSICVSALQVNVPYHQGICPKGWHVPSDDDWNKLIGFIHQDNKEVSYAVNTNSSIAGKYLKDVSGWNGFHGLDTYGFTGLMSGINSSGSTFSGQYLYFVSIDQIWTSSYSTNNYYRGLAGGASGYLTTMNRYTCSKISHYSSLRCIKDPQEEGDLP